MAGIAIPPETRDKRLAMAQKRVKSKGGNASKAKDDKSDEKDERSPEAVAFGLRLASLRNSKGITQQELATKIDVAVGAISHWERGLGEPAFKHLRALAQHFGLGLDALAKEGGHTTRSDSQVFHDFLRTPEGRIAVERGWVEQILKIETPKPPTVQLLQMITNAYRMAFGDAPSSRD